MIPSFERLDQWHKKSQFNKIIDAITAMPEGEKNLEYTGHLARAYANTYKYGKACDLLSAYRAKGESNALWNCRMGLCLYETNRQIESIPYLERAIALGDNNPETAGYLKSARMYKLENNELAKALPKFTGKTFQNAIYKDDFVFLHDVNIEDIPWICLATAYGRAASFPQYLTVLRGSEMSEIDMAKEQIALNIEHQSTLWPATPFAMIFLARILEDALSDIKKEVNRHLSVHLLDMFILVAASCSMANKHEHTEPLPFFADMLDEKYLWANDDEENDEARYEEEGGPFPDDLFYSFYFYSGKVLATCKNELEKHLQSDNIEISGRIKRLLSLID